MIVLVVFIFVGLSFKPGCQESGGNLCLLADFEKRLDGWKGVICSKGHTDEHCHVVISIYIYIYVISWC